MTKDKYLNEIIKLPIKFYKNASHKTYLYIAIQIDDKLLIYKIKFDKEYNLKKVEFNEYKSVIGFYLINSLLKIVLKK